jgi:hypothetical protein
MRSVFTWNTVEPGYNDSVYTTPGLQRRIFRGTNKFLTVNHNIIVLGFNNTRL